MDEEKSLAQLEKELSDKQIRFVHELLSNKNNATAAAISAGYSPKSAASQASRLLTNDKVLAYKRAYAVKVYEALGVTPESLALELEEIKRRCMVAEPHLSWNPDTKSWEPDGLWIFNAKGAIAAIKTQAAMMGMMAPQKVKVDGEVKVQSLEEYLENLGVGREF